MGTNSFPGGVLDSPVCSRDAGRVGDRDDGTREGPGVSGLGGSVVRGALGVPWARWRNGRSDPVLSVGVRRLGRGSGVCGCVCAETGGSASVRGGPPESGRGRRQGGSGRAGPSRAGAPSWSRGAVRGRRSGHLSRSTVRTHFCTGVGWDLWTVRVGQGMVRGVLASESGLTLGWSVFG